MKKKFALGCYALLENKETNRLKTKTSCKTGKLNQFRQQCIWKIKETKKGLKKALGYYTHLP